MVQLKFFLLRVEIPHFTFWNLPSQRLGLYGKSANVAAKITMGGHMCRSKNLL